MKKKQLNLTSGPILRTLSELALPIMASSFLSTAYNITDMAWIGMLGSKAVAGVGVGGMYVWLSQGLSSLARMGGQVNMAHSLGRGDQKTAAGFAQAALQLTILFSLFVTLISMLFTNPLLHFFALNDAETYNSARIYMRITCGLILFSFLSQVLTGLFTAQGDSKTPLKANFFGLILNMILDPLLVLGVGPFPRLEVVGAAVATVTAQIIVLLILVAEILRDHGETNVLHKIRLLSRPDIACLKGVFRIGTPTALQGSLYCIISMILTRMVSGFGDGAIAVQRVGGQIESLSWNTADGFGSALNAFMGQNYGAGKKIESIRIPYFHSASDMLAALITIAFVFFPRQISVLFSTRRKLSGFPLITCESSDFPKFFSAWNDDCGCPVWSWTDTALQSDQRWPDCYTNPPCTGSVKHCTGTEWNLVGTDTFHRFKGNYFLFCVPVYLRTQSVKNYK